MKNWYRPFLKEGKKILWLSEEAIALSRKYGFRHEIGEYAVPLPEKVRKYPLPYREILRLLEKHPSFASILKLSLISQNAGTRLFLVGGALRDLLFVGKIYREPDLLLEGNVDTFIDLALKSGYVLKERTPFLTLKLRDKDGIIFDISVCRKETYEFPGALPKVIPATLSEDLGRRDFTINAMALGLTDPGKGLLYDPFWGLEDLKRGVLRVLKPYSFLEDSTRIIRGIRLKARFSFRFDSLTLKLMRMAINKGALRWVGWVRIWRELEELFKEKKAVEGILLMESLGCWESIGLKIGDLERTLLKKFNLTEIEADVDRVEFLLLIVFGVDPKKDPQKWGNLFQLSKRLKRNLSLAPLWSRFKRMDFKERYEILKKAEKSVIRLWSLCLNEDLIPLWEMYNKARPILTEKEIERLASGKGPEYGRIKMEVLRLQLEEGVNNRDEILRRLKERSV